MFATIQPENYKDRLKNQILNIVFNKTIDINSEGEDYDNFWEVLTLHIMLAATKTQINHKRIKSLLENTMSNWGSIRKQIFNRYIEEDEFKLSDIEIKHLQKTILTQYETFDSAIQCLKENAEDVFKWEFNKCGYLWHIIIEYLPDTQLTLCRYTKAICQQVMLEAVKMAYDDCETNKAYSNMVSFYRAVDIHLVSPTHETLLIKWGKEN